jgi:hypothetical protein
MKQDKKMNRNAEIARTLEILDKLPEIKAGSSFRVRLMLRIESMESKPYAGYSVSSRAFSPRMAFLTLLLVLNVASAMLFFMHGQSGSTATASGTLAESFSDEYGGPALSYYDDQSNSDQ